MWRRLVFLAFSVTVTNAGCSEARGIDRAGMEHGLAINDRIELTLLSCRNGERHEAGREGAVEIVTFATPFDCVYCSVHLSGLVELVDQLPEKVQPPVLVLWSPSDTQLERAVDKFGDSGFDLCHDVEGTLWDRYNLTNTPFTVVLRNGRVVYLNDWALDEAAGEQFLADVQNLIADGS